MKQKRTYLTNFFEPNHKGFLHNFIAEFLLLLAMRLSLSLSYLTNFFKMDSALVGIIVRTVAAVSLTLSAILGSIFCIYFLWQLVCAVFLGELLPKNSKFENWLNRLFEK